MTTEEVQQTMTKAMIGSFTDFSFITVFLISLLFFSILQQIGETVYSNTLTAAQKRKTSRTEFGTYFQSCPHAIIIFFSSLCIIIDENNYFYKYITILSFAYYFHMTIYEFFVPQTKSYLLLMIVHHIFCGFNQFPVYFFGGIIQVISALNFQCEISNLFMNLSWFAQQFDNEYYYKLSGYGILITYPITRVIILPVAMYKTYTLDLEYVPIEYYWFAICGEIFVLLMSGIYAVYIIINPRKLLDLNLQQSDKQKSA